MAAEVSRKDVFIGKRDTGTHGISIFRFDAWKCYIHLLPRGNLAFRQANRVARRWKESGFSKRLTWSYSHLTAISMKGEAFVTEKAIIFAIGDI